MNSKNIINILIGVMVVVAIALSYFYFTSKKDTTTTVQTGASIITVNLSPEAQQIIGRLNELRAIKLNKALLESTAFQSLKSTTVIIPSEELGTPNPFQPAKF